MVIALKDIRKQRGFEVEDLAEMTGLSKQVIWSYEAGRTNPDPETLCLLADALNCSLDRLVRGKEKDRPVGRSVKEIFTDFESLTDEHIHMMIQTLQAILAERHFQALRDQETREN